MDGSSENVKKVPVEELSKDELISKCRNLFVVAQKVKQAKDALNEENNKLKEQLIKQQTFSSEDVIQKLTQQKGDLLTALEELKSEKVHLDNKFIYCESKLHDAENKISDLDTANQSYKRRVDRLTDENEQLILNLDQLEKQIEKLKTEGLQQQQQLLALEKNNALLAKISEEKNAELIKQIKQEKNSQMNELKDVLTTKIEAIKVLKIENSKLSNDLKNVDTLLKNNEQQVSSKNIELCEKIKIIEDLNVRLNEAETCNNSEDILRESDELNKKIMQLENELKQSKDTINNLNKQVGEKDAEISKNLNIVDDLKTELHKNKALVEKLQLDMVNMNIKLSDNQIMSSGVASDLANANDKLKEKLKLYHAKIVKFANDVKHLKESKVELLLTFKMYTSQVSEWKERLHLLLTKIECQDIENKKVVSQNQEYEDIIKKKTQENEMLLKDIKEFEAVKDCNKLLKDEINLLHQKLSNIEQDISNSNDEHTSVIHKKENLEKTIKKLQMECVSLQERSLIDHNQFASVSNQLESERREGEEKFERMRDEYDVERLKLNEKLKECQENLEELIEENGKLKFNMNDLNIKVEKYNELQVSFQELQENLNVLKGDINKNNLITETYKEEIATANHNYAEVTKESKALEEMIDSLKKEYNNLMESSLQDREKIVKEMEKVQMQLTGELEEERKDKEKLQEEIQQFKEAADEHFEKYKELSLEKQNLKASVEELNRRIEEFGELQRKFEENQMAVVSLRIDMQNAKEEIVKLETLNKNLTEQLNGANRMELQLAEKSGEEIISLVKKNEKLVTVIKNLEGKIEGLTNLPSSEKEIQTGNDLYNFEEIISSLKRENAELLSEMNEMNQALKERGGTISNQEAYCEEILKKLQNYETQCKSNKDILNKKDELIENLKEEVNSLKTVNQTLNNESLDISNRKDEEIKQLKLEIHEFRDKLLSISQSDVQSDVNYSESENMSTSTISKTEEINRMKDLDSSWEERYGKLRNLAVKQKGKIRDLTSDLQKEQMEKTELYQKHAKTIQTFQQQIDKLQDDLESSKTDCKQYLKKLDSVALEVSKDKKQLAENDESITQLKSEIDGLNREKNNTDNWKKQVSAKVQAFKKEQEANNLLKKEFENKINKLNVELENKDKALKLEIEKHIQTKSILHESNNECKKQSVLNLEMQDYERSVKELSQKIDKKQELINKLKAQLDTQKTSMNTMKDQNQELEESVKTWEDKYDKITGESEYNKKKISELENNISEKDNKLQDLTYLIENIRSDNEDLSTQLSKAIAEHQKLNNALKDECDVLKSRNMGLEQTLREVQDVLKLKEQEFSEMQREYQGYKVRAQSVLRQNQSRDVGTEEKLTEEAASLRAQVDILTTELEEVRRSLEGTISNNERLQKECEEHLEKMKSLELSIENHKTIHEQLIIKHQDMIMEHTETVRGLKIHSDTLAQCYRQQLSEQETRHNREIIELQSKVDRGHTPPDSSPVVPSMPREEGEGSESVDSAPNNGLHPIPLEKLLNTESEHDLTSVKRQLSENESKVVHLTALLADTEQDLAKYVQLNKVLKEEIRRQQRSTEREQHAENLEYLKNVVLKFITLGNGDERMRLVPVLNTILKLSPEETQKLNNVARGEKGWSNYLPLSWGSPNKPQ